MSINAILFSNKYPTLPVTGRVGDLLVLDMEIMLQFIMLLCALNVIFYVLVWVLVRFFYPANSDIGVESDSQSRLFKSLVLIITIVIGGYVINSICRLIVNRFFNLNDIQNWYVSVLGGLLLNIGASAETPTLYIFSTIYRQSINKQLKYLFCKKSQSNVISVIPFHQITSGALPNNNKGMIERTKQLTNKNNLNNGIIIKNSLNNSLTKNIKI
uniref:G_PROTEIN_RECEP_F1_2 domain-containing protein n=1 Tax=Meloidogyne hapla TaxID=6305 RepID=A0A1I8BG93_MELHA